MAEIKCPKCGEIIKLDKSDYDALLNNIEKEEVEKRVKEHFLLACILPIEYMRVV